MAKSINGTIEDRIVSGFDAIWSKLKMAKGSDHEEVVAAAVLAREKFETAQEYLDAVDEVQKRCQRESAEAKRTGDDPRQEKLDVEERCRDCEHAEELDGEAQPGPDGENYHCTEIANDVHGDTLAADQECGYFKPRETGGDGE